MRDKLIRIAYNMENDSYELRISKDGAKSWTCVMSERCKRSVEDAAAEEPTYISCELVEQLKSWYIAGYQFVY